MSISTFGATNNSLNQGATYVGASPKSLRTVGGKTFTRYNTSAAPMGGLFELFNLFGGSTPKNEENVEEIIKKFYKYITRYKKRPLDFFKDEIGRFHFVADKTIKKLSKLYALTHKPQTNESIINWELHMKLMEKKYGNRIVKDF